MTDQLQISYELEKVDPNLHRDSVESFVEFAMRGVVTISCGERSSRIPPCGLLRVSRSLVRLCTFPVLYGEEAHESVLDYAIDFRSVYENGKLRLEIMNLDKKAESMTLSLLVADAQRIIGDFHKGLLFHLFRRCPELLDENLLMFQIPDAFPLSLIERFQVRD